jgi:hypothetical protein
VNLALKEYDLSDLMDSVVTPLTDLSSLYAHNKNEIKEERVLLDLVKDHLIPHLKKKNIAKVMLDALVSLFHNNNMNRNIILRNKIRSVHMSRSYNVIIYLMRIT